jgi:CRP-like cAMP-binding protein
VASREIQRRVRELTAALQAEPGSIPKRLELAAALRDAHRYVDAIELYRGVAAAYAEDGRLVQAMAVCKGILAIDPEHRDTLEMLARLAQRKPVRPTRSLSELRRVDGRWVAEPTEGGAPADDADPTGEGAGSQRAAPIAVEATRAGTGRRKRDLATRVGDDPDATRKGADDSEWGDARDTQVSPLDFPPEAKARARGKSLLDLPPPPLDFAPPPPEEPGRDTEQMQAVDPARYVDDDGPAPDPQNETRAASPRAAIAPRAPRSRAPDPPAIDPLPVVAPARPSDELIFEDVAEEQILAEVLHGPFPRPELLADPAPFPLLCDLPREAFVELLSHMTVLRLAPRMSVLREGERGDACYLIAAGQVRVSKQGVELAVLGPGSFFGEFAVLADQRRHASVDTVEDCELLEIRRQVLDQLVAAHPGVARTLRTFYRERLLQTLLATAPFFERLPPAEREAVSERFRPRRFGRGAHIIEEGAPGGGLFLILVGEVTVLRGQGPEEVVLGTLGEGSYFGEMSLLKGGVASATVRAARMTEVVQLSPRDFYEVVSQHPVLWEQLRSEAERRELANHAILAGEARRSPDGQVYLI